MASADRLTRLRAIRDNLEKELANETERRAALTTAGHPPPATYSVGGKSVSWTEYMSMMVAQVKELSSLITSIGGDEGGIPEVSVRLWA